jgi:ribulose-phosphate 3-epimerase
MQIKIYPSLLAADFGHLADEAKRAEQAGADALHLDIMDAHFVPNLSMGPDVVNMARETVDIPLNVHLMMTNPDQFVTTFIDAGSSSLLIHIEASCDVPEALERIRDLGARPGITLNPETPAELVYPVLDAVDEILCMTVRPGYGGQTFDASVLPKIRQLRDKATEIGRDDLDILVDGGINIDTGAECARHGANALIAGTFLFRSDDMPGLLNEMRAKATEALTL